MLCSDEHKEYVPFESLEKSQIEELENLEKKLKYYPFINGNIITKSDVIAYQQLNALNTQIPKEKFPKIDSWIKEIKRLERNWKLSKRTKNNGNNFLEYVEIMNTKLSNEDVSFANKMKDLKKLSDKINGNQPPEKEIATITFNPVKEKKYEIKVLVKFLPNIEGVTEKGITSKIAIISHNHFVNKCQIEASTNDKGEISAILKSSIDKDNFDIEPFANEVKRNINGIYNISIQSIEQVN